MRNLVFKQLTWQLTLDDFSIWAFTIYIYLADLVIDPADTTQIISVGDGLSLQCKMISDDIFDERSIDWYFNGASDPVSEIQYWLNFDYYICSFASR